MEVAYGDADGVNDVANRRWIAENYGGSATLVELPGAGHKLRGDAFEAALEAAVAWLPTAGVALVEDLQGAVAVAVAIELPSLKRIDGAVVPVATALPYEPGYVGFRAAPFLARALKTLKVDVAVALVRGHGFLHPRKFGVACHAGLLAGVPTCGVADSLLRVDGEERAQALARVLLDRGADPNLASRRYGTTPCGEAAGISKDFMKLIVQAGGRLASDPSPFFYACGGEVRLWRITSGRAVGGSITSAASEATRVTLSRCRKSSSTSWTRARTRSRTSAGDALRTYSRICLRRPTAA